MATFIPITTIPRADGAQFTWSQPGVTNWLWKIETGEGITGLQYNIGEYYPISSEFPSVTITGLVAGGNVSFLVKSDDGRYFTRVEGFATPPVPSMGFAGNVLSSSIRLFLTPILLSGTANAHVTYKPYMFNTETQSYEVCPSYACDGSSLSQSPCVDISGLSPNTTYTFKLATVLGNAESALGAGITVHTPEAGISVAQITPLTNMGGGTFSWSLDPEYNTPATWYYSADGLAPQTTTSTTTTVSSPKNFALWATTTLVEGGTPCFIYQNIALPDDGVPLPSNILGLSFNVTATATTNSLTFTWSEPITGGDYNPDSTQWNWKIINATGANIQPEKYEKQSFSGSTHVVTLTNNDGLEFLEAGNASIGIEIWATLSSSTWTAYAVGIGSTQLQPITPTNVTLVNATETTATLRWDYGYADHYLFHNNGETIWSDETGIPASAVTRVDGWGTPAADGVCEQYTITGITPNFSSENVRLTRISNGQTSEESNSFVVCTATGPMAITSWLPNNGTVDGGTSVDFYGSYLDLGAAYGLVNVLIDGRLAPINQATFDHINITTPPGARTGSVPVAIEFSVFTPPTTITPQTFEYTPSLSEPQVSSMSPAAMALQTGGEIRTITGSQFMAGVTVSFGGIPASVEFISSTELRCTIPASETTGYVDVVVTNPTGIYRTKTVSSWFQYYAEYVPQINSLSLYSGTTDGGDRVTLYGSQFVSPAAVWFGAEQAIILRTDNFSWVEVFTPRHAAGAETISIVLENGQVSTYSDNFNFVSPTSSVTLTSISPNSAPANTATNITVNGTGFVSGASIYFDDGRTSYPLPVATNVVVVNSTTITCTTPDNIGVGTWPVHYAQGGNRAQAYLFRFTADAPLTIASVTPNTADVNDWPEVTISGTGFTDDVRVMFGDRPAAILNVTPTTIQCRLEPAYATGSIDVSVTCGQLTVVLESGFSYTYASPLSPSIISVYPDHGSVAGGEEITIEGDNFINVTEVLINGLSVQFEQNGLWYISAITPPAETTGTVNVSVIAHGETALAENAFTYTLPVPVITEINPPWCSEGATITISGMFFVDVTEVSVDGVPMTVSSSTETSIVCVVPALPQSGTFDVVVTAHGLASEPAQINYEGNEINPPQLSATEELTSTSAKIQWTFDGAADSYNLHIGETVITNIQFVVEGEFKTYTITNLSEGALVQDITIAAVINEGETPSNAIQIQLLPGTPVQPVILPGTNPKFNIYWAAANGADGYAVYMRTSEPDSDILMTPSPITMTSFELDPQITPNTAFQVYIVASNASGSSLPSATASAYTYPQTPVPEILAPSLTTSGFTVTWESGNNAASFQVYVGQELKNTVASGASSAIIDNMASNARIANVRVVAVGSGTLDELGYQPLKASSTNIAVTSPCPELNSHTLSNPPQMANPAVSAITDTTAQINWVRTNTEVFNVYLDGIRQNQTPIDGTSFVITGLYQDHVYSRVTVKSVNAVGKENHTALNVPAFTTLATPAQVVVVTDIKTNAATLVWNEMGKACNIYMGAAKINAEPITRLWHEIALSPNAWYESISLRAINRDDVENPIGAPSPEFRTLAESAISATTSTTHNSITYNWVAPGTGVGSYRVKRNGAVLAEASSSPVTVEGLLPNTTYICQLVSTNDEGEENLDNPLIISATTLAAAPTATPIQNTDTSAFSTVLNWTAQDAASFNVYDGENNKINASPVVGNRFTLGGLMPNQQYVGYKVRAVNKIGVENPTALEFAPFLTEPDRPVNLAGTYDPGQLKRTITWQSPINGAASYKILVNGVEQQVNIQQIPD